MPKNNDEIVLELLEKAVSLAKEELEKNKTFSPFLLLLTDTKEELFFKNDEKDSEKSYELLEKVAKETIAQKPIEIMILVADTTIPQKFAKDIPMGIRLHLEEKSQLNKPIGARFIYAPYELCQNEKETLFVKLHHPIPVGFPAEYIKL